MAQNQNKTILLGEDDSEVRSYLSMALRCHGYTVETAQDGEEVLDSLQQSPSRISAILLDVVMPNRDGLEALREIRKVNTHVPVIMVSGASSPVNVVEAMRLGATDFLGKPISPEDLIVAVKRGFERHGTNEETHVDVPAAEVKNLHRGVSPKMKEIESLVRQVGWSEAPVLIQGETGVGKEMLARELHAYSPRASKPFLKLNCAALPSELVESELFGYERGAFTGAFQRKPGMFEAADGGTLLLDEIGDMDFKLQAKLLQVLQDQEFQRLGGKETIRVDVRLLAATHKDLDGAIAAQTFREDLYYRLNVINFTIPPLRERKEDILPLTRFLMTKHTPKGCAVPKLTPALEQALLAHHWPGNIRELDNLVRRFIILRNPEALIDHLQSRLMQRVGVQSAIPAPAPAATPVAAPAPATAPASAAPAEESSESIFQKVSKVKEDAETDAILAVLNSTCWNRKQAAALLNIDYKALLYKMKKLRVEEKMATISSAISGGRTVVSRYLHAGTGCNHAPVPAFCIYSQRKAGGWTRWVDAAGGRRGRAGDGPLSRARPQNESGPPDVPLEVD